MKRLLILAILLASILYTIPVTAADPVDYIGNVMVLDAPWKTPSTKVSVVISAALEKLITIGEVKLDKDYKTENRVLSMKFSFINTAAQGHIIARFYKVVATKKDLLEVQSMAFKVLTKPYLFLMYDTELMPPDLTKMIAVGRVPDDYEVVTLDYVSLTTDATKGDLEFKRQTSHVDYVNGKTWIPKVLGSPNNTPLMEEDDLER